MSSPVRYNAAFVEERVCQQCDRGWPMGTSMEQLARPDNDGVYHAAGPFCPDSKPERCAAAYERLHPQWWAVAR